MRKVADIAKKNLKIIVCILILAALCVGCKASEKSNSGVSTEAVASTQSPIEQKEETKKKLANTIQTIDVFSAVKNDENIYRITYPYNYVQFDKESMSSYEVDFVNAVEREALTSKDFEYIMSYIDSIPSHIGDLEGNQAFMIRVWYYDETGERQSKYVSGYESFPEGWSEFIDYINNLCGGDYLKSKGEVVGVTPELLTEMFGVTDADLKMGTLAELIELNELNLCDMTDYIFEMNVQINKYYDLALKPIIDPYRPTSIKTVDSTEEEYYAFVGAFLEMLGDGWGEYNTDQRNVRRFYNVETGMELYLGRSADLPDMSVWEPTEQHNDEYCEFQILGGPEGMVYTADFYYSKSGKYILITPRENYCDYTDIILGFIELE